MKDLTLNDGTVIAYFSYNPPDRLKRARSSKIMHRWCRWVYGKLIERRLRVSLNFPTPFPHNRPNHQCSISIRLHGNKERFPVVRTGVPTGTTFPQIWRVPFVEVRELLLTKLVFLQEQSPRGHTDALQLQLQTGRCRWPVLRNVNRPRLSFPRSKCFDWLIYALI